MEYGGVEFLRTETAAQEKGTTLTQETPEHRQIQEGVERIFPVNSPRVVNLTVKRKGVVRRAKLYYLRDRVGKATRVKERIVRTKKS